MSERTATAKKKEREKKKRRVQQEAVEEIPPELLLRRDRNVRYERGGTVYATDGRVGTLERIVVDELAGDVAELVVRVNVEGEERSVLVPTELVDKTAGSAVFVTVNRLQFVERAATAPAYEKRHFTKADLKAVLKPNNDGRERVPRRGVIQVGRDFVETPTVPLLERLERRPLQSVTSGQ